MLLPLATDVDNIKIVFEESSLTTLKIVIGAILFGIALDTKLEDFAAALKRPFAITVGVLVQFIALPAITVLLTAAPARISTPASRAAAAIAFEMAPVPPLAKPHDRYAPSIPPM